MQEGGVRGFVEGQAQRAVCVAQLNHLGAPPALPPPVEHLPPVVWTGLALRQVVGGQPPLCRGQDGAPVAHPGQERQPDVRTPVELVPGGGKRPWQVSQESGQRRGLLVQRERVKHLRLNDLAAREADQVQPVAGCGDGQVVDRDEAGVGGFAVLPEREQVVEVGRDTADVLRVRVQRPEGHLYAQRAVGGGGQCPVRLREAGAGGRRRESRREGASGAGGSDREEEVAMLKRRGAGGVNAGGQLDVRRDVALVERLVS